jgi:hypothetical protein
MGFPDFEILELGKSGRAFVRFLRPELHLPRMKCGMGFLIREGSKTIGYGSVTKIGST